MYTGRNILILITSVISISIIINAWRKAKKTSDNISENELLTYYQNDKNRHTNIEWTFGLQNNTLFILLFWTIISFIVSFLAILLLTGIIEYLFKSSLPDGQTLFTIETLLIASFPIIPAYIANKAFSTFIENVERYKRNN
jgi:hypothetical protein